jgi:hypothetical protein
MVKRKRDFRAEYKRRISRGLKRGLRRSQARGHPKPAEKPATKGRAAKPIEDVRLQLGLRLLQQGRSLTAVAKEIHVSAERLRSHGVQKKAIQKRNRRWVVRRDLPRHVPVYTNGRELAITVGDFDEASLVGQYMAHVRWFLQTNHPRHLKPFAGKSVKDIDGETYLLETRPNVLYQLSQSGGASYEEIYRIVV